METPSYLKLQYREQEIRAQAKRLGSEILPWAKQVFNQTQQDVLGIPVLRGAIFFFVDLVREIDQSIEIAPVRTWAYKTGQNQVESETVKVNLEGLDPKGRSVLLVDDLCDSGRTLQKLTTLFHDLGAKEVRSAVLIKRELEGAKFEPTYVGFRYPGHEWFVGYGMEDGHRFRNLRDIYLIEK